jgi:hypothetical protein
MERLPLDANASPFTFTALRRTWSEPWPGMIFLISAEMKKLLGYPADALWWRAVISKHRHQWRLCTRALAQRLASNLQAKHLADRGWDRIAELAAHRGRSALDLPVIWEALKAGHLTCIQPATAPVKWAGGRSCLCLKGPRRPCLS